MLLRWFPPELGSPARDVNVYFVASTRLSRRLVAYRAADAGSQQVLDTVAREARSGGPALRAI
jgi:hypothetical protein